MRLDSESLRFIFGLKLRMLRHEKRMSLKELSQVTGLSPSYLNEIEKGKKYPKADKILSLTQALGIDYDELTSVKLEKELRPLTLLLEKNILKGLPLEVYGIPMQSLFEIMSQDPQKFNALVGTTLELARNFNIKVEDVFSAALRAFLQLNNNYFPTLEESAEEFCKQLKEPPTKENLSSYLKHEYGYEIKEVNFENMNSTLKGLYYFTKPTPKPTLYLNKKIGNRQKVFILSRELGYCHLNLKARLRSSLPTTIDSYEVLYNHFASSYFANAILIPQNTFLEEAKDFFSQKKWNNKAFLKWANQHPGTRRNFIHRLSQILPHFFGLDQIFYFRFNYKSSEKNFKVIRELHIADLHVPHRMYSEDHYCRRWIATSLIQELTRKDEKVIVGAQRSEFFGTGREYLCFSIAYSLNLNPDIKEGVTIGLLINEKLKETIQFWDAPHIKKTVVSTFCELCLVENCEERIAEARLTKERESAREIQKIIEELES